MPLRLDIKRKVSARSDRVKCSDLHPTEPWMLVSLYNGHVHIWNHETQTLIKTFEVCDLPVRAAKFVARKNWIVTGSDDMTLRVYNYNTLEAIQQVDAHSDYLRSIAVHPTQSYVLTSSDDMLIKLWDWDKKWTCTQVFEGHTHYVMQIVINPKDNNTFASASLDRTLKVWQLGSSTPNFTLEGHEKGVNCVDYYHGGDKPYIISGADDRQVKIWDYQNKTCVQTLEGHAQNISAVVFHPELPVIMTGSEDGTVRVWHANTYRLESTLNYAMERVWTMACQRGSNAVVIGYDEGSIMIKLGREEPAMSMDANGKIIWAKHAEIQQANIKSVQGSDMKDGERIPLTIKDMGPSEIYPQTIAHNPNGRFVVVCGDGEYIVYTAMALRNKTFGQALDFVWSNDSTVYAIRESSSMVKIFKNFKETKNFKPDFGAEAIFGGQLLGVKTVSSLSFYDWDSTNLVRRIEIMPKHVIWNEGGELVCIATEESFYILKFCTEALENGAEPTDDGVEEAFQLIGEVDEVVKTGCWVGDCFIYTNAVNRLNYYVGGEIVTVAHLDRVMYLLGYSPRDNRIYLGDKELNVISFGILLSVLEYQTAVMRKDFDTADKVLPTIPREQRTRVAHFLEKQGFKPQALAVTCDPEHKFDLALQLNELKIAYDLALESDARQKWMQLADLAVKQSEFGLAQECMHHAQDFASLLMLASSAGNVAMVDRVAEASREAKQNNISFMAYFIRGKLDECLEILIESQRLTEAAFFARTYLPSKVSDTVQKWKEFAASQSKKVAQSLADPADYENLFPEMSEHLKTEKYLKLQYQTKIPAAAALHIPPNWERKPVEEMMESLNSGKISLDTLETKKLEEPEPEPQSACAQESKPEPESVPEPEPKPIAVSEPQTAQQSIEELEKELELDMGDLDLQDENIGSEVN
ncbi:DgyrCDS5237 [Dimorphilus gyrociliatus]|uniref:Coatomer subunit beta' n=1 Tax=Dimorphilus gyrociliatus TaxID=2664684 RepID=A0A7I8VLZ1_9ANNE|nr:DgyrCDS5237 [Dimorphilus gyrociliatus]